MTALLVLAGLYPPAPVQQWNEDLEWMPIPYHFERGEHDYVGLYPKTTKRFLLFAFILVYSTPNRLLSNLLKRARKGSCFE